MRLLLLVLLFSLADNINCGYSPWGEWSECSATCGDAFKTRTRQCGKTYDCNLRSLTETQFCPFVKCEYPDQKKPYKPTPPPPTYEIKTTVYPTKYEEPEYKTKEDYFKYPETPSYKEKTTYPSYYDYPDYDEEKKYPEEPKYPAPKEEYPVYKEEYPALKEEYPVYKEEYPVYKEEYPVSKEEYPVYKEEYPKEPEHPVYKEKEPYHEKSEYPVPQKYPQQEHPVYKEKEPYHEKSEYPVPQKYPQQEYPVPQKYPQQEYPVPQKYPQQEYTVPQKYPTPPEYPVPQKYPKPEYPVPTKYPTPPVDYPKPKPLHYTYTVVVTTSDSQNDVLSADAVISLEINAGNTLTGVDRSNRVFTLLNTEDNLFSAGRTSTFSIIADCDFIIETIGVTIRDPNNRFVRWYFTEIRITNEESGVTAVFLYDEFVQEVLLLKAELKPEYPIKYEKVEHPKIPIIEPNEPILIQPEPVQFSYRISVTTASNSPIFTAGDVYITFNPTSSNPSPIVKLSNVGGTSFRPNSVDQFYFDSFVDYGVIDHIRLEFQALEPNAYWLLQSVQIVNEQTGYTVTFRTKRPIGSSNNGRDVVIYDKAPKHPEKKPYPSYYGHVPHPKPTPPKTFLFTITTVTSSNQPEEFSNGRVYITLNPDTSSPSERKELTNQDAQNFRRDESDLFDVFYLQDLHVTSIKVEYEHNSGSSGLWYPSVITVVQTSTGRSVLFRYNGAIGADSEGASVILYPTVDGGFCAWSAWSSPSVTCVSSESEQVFSRRSRRCACPEPQNYGLDCVGDSEEQRSANLPICFYPPQYPRFQWTQWGKWSPCVGGIQMRARDCIEGSGARVRGGNEKTCSGYAHEEKLCSVY